MSISLLPFFIQGSIIPAFVGGIGVWSPPDERSTIMALAVSGQIIGIVVVTSLGGVISDFIGWEWVFYITGIVLQLHI